ncbi:MAG: SAM-dependent methyltransferase [Jatrophihabitantaceae bacterium]
MQIPLLPDELHTTDRPSATAQWTTLVRALELARRPEDRIASDEYAPMFLTAPYRALLESLRLGSPLVRLAERHELAGISTYVLLRHRFIDEQLHQALAGGAEQVVVLGAGYDSRAYRFADELHGRPVHEVDLAPLSRRKAEIVAAHPDEFGGNRIRRIEIDFRTESLADRLLDSGFSVGVRTVVVWEGVSMYLSHLDISATLATLREVCGPASTLAMDFWSEPTGAHPYDHVRRAATQAIRLIGEPVTFGVAPEKVTAFLDRHGFDVTELLESIELAARYSTGGRPSEKSLYVVAAQLR